MVSQSQTRLGAGSGRGPLRLSILSVNAIVAHGLASMLEPHEAIRVLEGDRHHELRADPRAEVVVYDALHPDVGQHTQHLDRLAASPAAVVAVSEDVAPSPLLSLLAKTTAARITLDMSSDEVASVVIAAGTGSPQGIGSTPRPVPAVPLPRVSGSSALVDALSPREAEILGLIAVGLSNAEIAAQLYLSINSVKTYIRGAYRKIGVVRRSQAVIWAVQHGLTGSSRSPETVL